MIDKAFQENWKKTFLIDAKTGKEYTYADIANIALNLSGIIKPKPKKVLFHLENSVLLASLYFWGLFNNIKIFPLSPKTTVGDVKKVASGYGIDLIISNNPELGLKIEEFPLERSQKMENLPKVDIYEPLFFFLTSGSTGESKCVVHSFVDFYKNARRFIDFHGLTFENRFFVLLEMTYMAGFYNTFLLPFFLGGSTVINEAFKPTHLFNFWKPIFDYKVNTLWLVPTVIKLLNSLDRSFYIPFVKERLKFVFSCTAPLPLEEKKKFREKYGVRIFNTYGLSEVLFVSSERRDCYMEEQGSVGKPLIDIILSEEGEILINNPKESFQGYVNLKGNAKLSDEVFPTKDVGFTKDGCLYIVGRKDDLIIRGGVNIYPVQLEEKIRSMSYVRECAVVGVEDEVLGERVVCFVIFQDSTNEKEALEQLKEFAKKEFPTDKTIDEIIPLKEFPLNRNFKVDRKRLKELYRELKK